jgi:hypothetical protein
LTGQSPDKNELLLGIKYESARLGGVSEDALAAIAGQVRDEVGEDWESDEGFIAGRNAVRGEHGLERLGGGEQKPVSGSARRPWHEGLKRLLGG